MALEVGIYRTDITPPWGVELAGLGYYLERTWTRVRDELKATALVACQDGRSVALVAVDLMYADAEFTRLVREQVARHTDIPPEAVCVSVSHSHSAPTAGYARGVGDQDLEYLALARRQVATAVICAWRQRRPATLWAGRTTLEGMTFNRTRQGGEVDSQVSVLRADGADGRPFAAVVNFHAHPTVMMYLDQREVSRDYPGYVVDTLERSLPGLTAMFVQGSCGDVNFNMELWDPSRCLEAGRALAGRALEALGRARRMEAEGVGACSLRLQLPTKRYAREEVRRENEEGRYRLESGDTAGWRETLGRVMVGQPDRFPERYDGDVGRAVKALARFAVEWTEEVLPDLDTRPETLETEVQALRFGDLYAAAHGSELFTSFSLDLRRRWPHPDLMVVGYANCSLSYMPDAHDVERRSYAAAQSPKFTGHFPFTAESGARLVDGMLAALAQSKGGGN